MALTAPKSSGSAGRISTVVPSARSAYTRPVSCAMLTSRLPGVSAHRGCRPPAAPGRARLPALRRRPDVHLQAMRGTLRAVTVTTGYPDSQLSGDDRAARYPFQARHGVRFTTANGPRL